MPGVSGYILVIRKSDKEVFALSGGRHDKENGPKPPREVSHSSIEECFVHSDKAIKRAVRARRPWIEGVTEAYDAFYDSHGDCVYLREKNDPAGLWDYLKKRFLRGAPTAASKPM